MEAEKEYRLIVGRLKCGKEHGTVFLVTSSIAITACHCIKPHLIDRSVEIALDFRYMADESVKRTATLLYDNEHELDIAVLKLKSPVDVGLSYIELSNDPVKRDEEYEIFGHPVESHSQGERINERIRDIDIKPASGIGDLDLKPEVQDGSFKGLSGAPVFISGKIKAVVVRKLARSFEAISIQKICSNLEVEAVQKLYEVETYEKNQKARWGTEFLSKDRIRCFVVVSEVAKDEKQIDSLGYIVNEALTVYRSRVTISTGKEVDEEPVEINVTEIFSSCKNYKETIIALCHADVVVFDVTGFEPAIMLLIGIRSVVKRGVTILTTLDWKDVGAPVSYPFSIRDINVISHSDKLMEKKNISPSEIIGQKIEEGFKQMRNMPHYLDLPVFDAVRTVFLNSDKRNSIVYDKQVLVLCPFAMKYQDSWNSLKKGLRTAIIGELNKERERIPISERPKKVKPPAILRTLDMKSPRLISQSLYEAIRITDMCVVDWTHWNPNVFFELGVRTAVRDIGPVCILEESSVAATRKNLEQYELLKVFFSLITYVSPRRIAGGRSRNVAYKEMVSYHKELRKLPPREYDRNGKSPDLTYRTITEWLDSSVELASIPVYEELLQTAEQLSGSDIASEGKVSLLHQNDELVAMARKGSLERRLAAWFYLDNWVFRDGMPGSEDAVLCEKFEDIGYEILGILSGSKSESDKKLCEQIQARIDSLYGGENEDE